MKNRRGAAKTEAAENTGAASKGSEEAGAMEKTGGMEGKEPVDNAGTGSNDTGGAGGRNGRGKKESNRVRENKARVVKFMRKTRKPMPVVPQEMKPMKMPGVPDRERSMKAKMKVPD